MVAVTYSELTTKSDRTTLKFDWKKLYRVLHQSFPQQNIWHADLNSMVSATVGLD